MVAIGLNRRRIGIKEVASAAGVSVTTVSHALNGKGRLPDSTRARVRRVADDLGYSPSAAARNLVGGRTGLLGLAVSQAGAPTFAVTDFAYFTQLMMAATTEAMRRGYALVLASADGVLDPQGGITVDGAIIVDPVEGDPMLAELERSGVPVVTTGRTPGGGRAGFWVDNDHIAGTRAMLDHLRERGGERIALMTSPIRMSYTIDVELAYRVFCEEHGVTPMVMATQRDLTESAGIAAATELLDLPHPPDAIFATYDRLAFGTLLAAQAREIRVPEDLLLATTATESQAPEEALPSMTTLNLNPDEIGRRAAGLLVDILGETQPLEDQIIVPHRVIARSSTERHIRQ